MGFLDILRYTFYALDFIFGVMSWGITTDDLKFTVGNVKVCLLSSIGDRTRRTCNVVIAFGVITMVLLLVVALLRTLDILDKINFPELIEFFSFVLMTIIWFILAIITVAVTDTQTRELSRVRGAIAGAWIAFITHGCSSVISILAYTKRDVETETKE